MSLKKLRKNLNKASAVVAVIGIATCVFPAIAQAQLRRPSPLLDQTTDFSGNSNDPPNVNINFSLDTSVQNTNSPGSAQGEFPGAIQNFTDSGNPNSNLRPLSFPSGDLTASRLTTDPTGNFPGLDIGYNDITGNTPSSNFSNHEGLRYDVTFANTSETLTLFIPSNDSSLINSLSGLSDFLSSNGVNQIEGVARRDGIEEKFIITNPQPSRQGFTFTTVPEPNATASLLGLGAMGAVSLLKRNKREV